jgi:hypothetical protein
MGWNEQFAQIAKLDRMLNAMRLLFALFALLVPSSRI